MMTWMSCVAALCSSDSAWLAVLRSLRFSTLVLGQSSRISITGEVEYCLSLPDATVSS